MFGPLKGGQERLSRAAQTVLPVLLDGFAQLRRVGKHKLAGRFRAIYGLDFKAFVEQSGYEWEIRTSVLMINADGHEPTLR